MPIAYELVDVSRLYEQGEGLIHALDGIDLTIDTGEFVAVEGPSGSGKSTLLQMLGALDRPTSGQVRFEGIDLRMLSNSRLAQLRLEAFGFIFQQFNLIPTLTARENVEAALAPLKWRRKMVRAHAVELLEKVGLGGRANHLPSRLSGGEQQRVAIARALSSNPRVLLADEPTGNLDSKTGAEIIALLRSLASEQGKTVIVITHDHGIATQSPRAVQLRDGRILDDSLIEANGANGAYEANGVETRRIRLSRAIRTVSSRLLGEPEPEPNGHHPTWVSSADVASDRAVILRAQQVRKVYSLATSQVRALRDISLSIREGEFVAVTGPSGSGKTTLLNCLSGLDRIDGGRVQFQGQTIHTLPDKERSRQRAQAMGFVFQTWNLVPVFTASENVELPLLLAGVDSSTARRRANATLDRVGLGHRLDHHPAELSGGEQQRVAIARAIASGPKLVWADEPTGNLDSVTAASVMDLLRELNAEGLTVVLVTHDEGIASGATRRVYMRDGAILRDETLLAPALPAPAPAPHPVTD